MKRLEGNSTAALHLESGRYRIRNMTAGDLVGTCIPWMREAGWNPGLHDAETFFTADPGGFFIGELDGQAIATVSAVRYDDSFGFLGCYIVQEAFRGHGYGLAIHEHARRYLHGCVQGGDGVLENVEKYRRIGREYAYRNARYEGVKQGDDWAAGFDLVDARAVPCASLHDIDHRCFPAHRHAFLHAWIHQHEAHALACVDEREPEALLGYGVIRPCFRGWKIGPLFSRDAYTAEAIFRGLVGRIAEGDPFVLDIAEPNQQAMELVRQYGMKEVFATARMYTGPAPQVRLDWIYGVTTFELG